MTGVERRRFDAILERVLASLRLDVRALIERAPVIVEDRPDPELLREMGLDPAEESLCGLYTGTPLTEQSVEAPPEIPPHIHLFREPIVDEAGGWHGRDGGRRIAEEIRITILHEIGHHLGLEEDDLEDLGYG